MFRQWCGVLLIGCLLSQPLMAADYFYCSKSNSYIYPGATVDEVYQKCGEPISSEKSDTPPSEEQEVLEFTYYGQQSLLLLPPQMVVNIANTSMRPDFVIDMIDDQVVDIRINGQSVQSTYICRTDREISVGDSRIDVLQVCGPPGSQQTITQKTPKPTVQEVILSYQPNPYVQPTQLHFLESQLVKIEP